MRTALVLGLASIAVAEAFAVTVGSAEIEKQNGAEFRYTIPNDWKKVLPNKNNLLLTGPEAPGGRRPVVFISNTKIDSKVIRSLALQSDSFEYFEGRRRYIFAKGGELLRKIPYEKLKWNGVDEAHSVGVVYRIAGIEHHERTIYAVCGKTVFNLKRLDDRANSVGDEVIRSFRCVDRS